MIYPFLVAINSFPSHPRAVQLVAVKYFTVFEADIRHQMARELQSLFANIGHLPSSTGSAANAVAAARVISTLVNFFVRACCDVCQDVCKDLCLHWHEMTCSWLPLQWADEERLLALSMSSDGSGSFFSPSASATPRTPLEAAASVSPTAATVDPKSSTMTVDQLRGSNHVVKFFDAFADSEQGRVGIVMEYMGGGSLEDLVKAGGCQDEANVANMAAQILKVCHDR